MAVPTPTKAKTIIRKIRVSEITGPIREALLACGSPGLRYRAELDGLAIELIERGFELKGGDS